MKISPGNNPLTRPTKNKVVSASACDVVVPASAMHSFQAPHNAIHWKLVVRGRPRRRTPFERTFPVIVYPGTPAAASP